MTADFPTEIAMPRSIVDRILSHLASARLPGEVRIFGSCVTDKEVPGDVDMVLDLRPLTKIQWLQDGHGHDEVASLLRIAEQHPGSFDPFLRFAGSVLLVRTADSQRWAAAKEKVALLDAIERTSLSVQDTISIRKHVAEQRKAVDAMGLPELGPEALDEFEHPAFDYPPQRQTERQ